MYPYQRTPMGNKSLYRSQKWWVFMGYNPQESLENTINTMPTRTLGVHPSPAGFGQILHPVTKLNSPRILCRGELHSRRHISRRTFSDRKGILSKYNNLIHMRCFLWFPDVFAFNRLNKVFKLIHQYHISRTLAYHQLNVRKNGESYNQPTNPSNQTLVIAGHLTWTLSLGRGGFRSGFLFLFPPAICWLSTPMGRIPPWEVQRSWNTARNDGRRKLPAVRFQPAISNSDWIPRNVHIPPREKEHHRLKSAFLGGIC